MSASEASCSGYGDGDGSGYGSGYGDGYGYGSGYGDGYGYGSGYSSGYGYGYGSGYGYGYGDGYGYGYGDGDGDGYGSGYGDGYGYGYGDGYGYGYGYGYGDGYGYGYGEIIKEYLEAILAQYQSRNRGLVYGFWRSQSNGVPANGGDRKSVAKVGLIQEIEGPLALCSSRALHATLKPEKWQGSHWWVVALHPPVIQQDDKMGSLKREIIADLGAYPF